MQKANSHVMSNELFLLKRVRFALLSAFVREYRFTPTVYTLQLYSPVRLTPKGNETRLKLVP